MAGKNFYISDWHYGHKNAIAFDNRPFTSVEEMNNALIQNWNAVVSDDDTVYVLGDMFWCSPKYAIPVMDELNGKKILVKGNHDLVNNNEFREKFEKIEDYMEIKDEDKNVVLCHYPITHFKNHYHGWYHLYGHVHSSFEWNMVEHDRFLMRELYMKECNMYNVGCMMEWMGYTPRSLDEVILLSNGWRAAAE